MFKNSCWQQRNFLLKTPPPLVMTLWLLGYVHRPCQTNLKLGVDPSPWEEPVIYRLTVFWTKTWLRNRLMPFIIPVVSSYPRVLHTHVYKVSKIHSYINTLNSLPEVERVLFMNFEIFCFDFSQKNRSSFCLKMKWVQRWTWMTFIL